MSGGRLVVLDRMGRDMKRFPLAEGLATLGSDPACDIRIMLPTVSPHHATVVVHANQTVVRNVCEDDTLVNGRCVSVAALRHGDVISIGGRHLRWEYADTTVRRPQAPEPALYVPRRAGRAGPRRGSGPAAAARDPALQLAIEMTHRASMPGSAGGKQVAIVQPQRRDTSDQIEKNPPRTPIQANKRLRTSKSDLDTSLNETENEKVKRKSSARVSPKTTLSNLQNTTKATLWIESRKTSPRKSNKIPTPAQEQEQVLKVRRTTASAKKSTPLRLTVLKRTQSAQKMKVTKIESPLKMDHTKQAAILLMTGHTPKSKLSSPNTSKRTPSFVIKKPSPVRRSTPRSRNSRAIPSNSRATPGSSRATPGNSRATLGNSRATLGNSRATPGSSRATPGNRRATLGHTAARKSGADRTVTILEITDSDGRNPSLRTSIATRRSGQKSPKKSPALISPRKSALKDPSAKRGTRKTESIKFDLSNLENHSQDIDVMMVSDTSKHSYEVDSASDDDITLRYSESSAVQTPSPSPRRSIHSRSSKILERTLGTTLNVSSPSRTRTPESPRPKRSLRGSIIMQKALNDTDTLSYSRRTTKSISDKSQDATVASAYRTRTLSPRTSRNNLESYSIVDLVSIGTDESARSTSVYDSAASVDRSVFGTPQNSTGRKTRSTIDPTLLGSSTPYVKGRSSTPRSRSNPSPRASSKISMNSSQSTTRSSKSTRSKSLSTPENTENAKKHVSVNSTRISRVSHSRSRLNDSDLLLLDDDDDDDSPRTSKRISTNSKSTRSSVQTGGSDVMPINSPAHNEGISTPENRYSPEEASTPVLSIQSLLDSSQNSLASQRSTRRGKPSFNGKRKTIGGVTGRKTRVAAKSKSMNFSTRKTRLRLSNDSVEALNRNYDQQDSEIVTPKSAVKLVQEGVKNKHSTAKKPQSKRSIIDDLNESDIVKQLFNSPVKRKLSQSMTEFSRKQLFDDDDILEAKRPTRNTIALTGRSPDNSLLDHTESYTPELFVSPISTPPRSPNLEGIKLMFAKSTPENDLRNVRGVKGLFRTPRTRRSAKNDLTNVSGVKDIFTNSHENSLSDVRVKEVFASSPKNDSKRVSGVKSLFRTTKKKSPKNELDDVRGVKKLFKTRSPANDLRNVSGVKRTLRRNSPKNDLSDVRGVKRMFRREKRNDLNDVSGVEELFNLSNQSHRDAESLFDQLVGKPQIKAVYSKTFSTKTPRKTKSRNTKSLHVSLDLITNNVEEWLEQELNARLLKANDQSTSKGNKSQANMTRELQMLVTETVDGTAPIRTSRVRNSTITRSNESNIDRKKSASELYSAHTLPIKKRSLIEASMEKGNDSRANNLPIKKRAVVHSTPVKGRVNITMNASVLGRVSPITAVDETRFTEPDTLIRSNQRIKTTETRPKTRRGTKANTENVETSNEPEFVKPSPKKTRGRAKAVTPKANPASPSKEKPAAPAKAQKASPAKTKRASPAKKLASPVPAKTTRSRRKDVSIPESNTKKRSATLVVTKKSSVMSPKPRASRKRKELETSSTPKPTSKKTRATTKKDSVKFDKPKTPKNTRAKVLRATVVVSKPSPQLKPRTNKARGQAGQNEKKTTRKTRQTVIVEDTKPESPKKSQLQRKLSRKTRDADVQSAPRTRGRKTAANESKQNVQVEKPKVNTKKGHKTVEEPTNKRTRNSKQEKSIEEPMPLRTRGKKVDSQESVESQPTTRSRRGVKFENTKPEVKTRKRKSTGPDNEIPPKIRKSKEVAERGRKRTAEVKTETVNTRKKSIVKESKVEKVQVESLKSTRGRKVAELEPVKGAKEPEQRPVRGRKANVKNVPANQDTGKRKRATVAESSPAEDAGALRSNKRRATNKAAGHTPADARQRSTRGNTQAEAGKPAGRSRRR